MQCKSCNNDVSQKFQHAIRTNICPFCGGDIMSVEVQLALNNLAEAMKPISAYPIEMHDFLRENYELIFLHSQEYRDLQERANTDAPAWVKTKIDAPIWATTIKGEVGTKTQEVKQEDMPTDQSGNQIDGQPIQEPEQTSAFMERAGASKMAQRSETLKRLAHQIKTSSGGQITTEDGRELEITPETIAAANPEEIEAMEQMISGGLPEVHSAIAPPTDDDEIPAVVLGMAAQAKGGSGYNAKDIARLQALQQKSNRAKKELDEGGSVGLIRR